MTIDIRQELQEQFILLRNSINRINDLTPNNKIGIILNIENYKDDVYVKLKANESDYVIAGERVTKNRFNI